MELGNAVVPAILAADWVLGDPVYAWHPIRLMGKAIDAMETYLFDRGQNTVLGGIILAVTMCGLFAVPVWLLHNVLWGVSHILGFVWDVYWGFHCFALRDLVKHTQRIGNAVAKNDLPEAREATSMLVGRDVDQMDGHACCRAGIESLSENLTDGVIAPLFCFFAASLLGVPGVAGMVFFKVASTLDSMVGYKNERYLYFGWAGARLDDVLNYLPARITWILTVIVAYILRGYSAAKAYDIGLKQHARAPGPNSGWSEAAFAGALSLRIAGPIWKGGVLVTEIWLGAKEDRIDANPRDIRRAITLAYTITYTFVLFNLPLWI